jgi:hypothetical protein
LKSDKNCTGKILRNAPSREPGQDATAFAAAMVSKADANASTLAPAILLIAMNGYLPGAFFRKATDELCTRRSARVDRVQ